MLLDGCWWAEKRPVVVVAGYSGAQHGDQIKDMVAWLDENVGRGNFMAMIGYSEHKVKFKNEVDAILFSLKWSST